MKRRLSLSLLFVLAACTASPADDPQTTLAPSTDEGTVNDWLASEEVPTASVIVAAPDVSDIEASKVQDEPRLRVGLTVPVGARIQLDEAVGLIGATDEADLSQGSIRFVPGGFVWSAVVQAPGATSLRLGLEDLVLPEGAEFYVYNDVGQVDGPYRGAGRDGHRAFFSRTLSSDTVYLQLRYEGDDVVGALSAIDFTLTEVAWLDERFLHGLAPLVRDDKAHCNNLNDTCVENAECDLQDPGDDAVVQSLRDASAHMLFQSGNGWYICTGTLIESASGTPGHFLTAHHCISTASEAASLETYFHFTTPCQSGGTNSCNYADGSNSDTPTNFGAVIIDTSTTTDFTLMKLSGTPPAGTVHLPYSTTPVANTSGTQLLRVSYPAGAPQAFSEHQVDANWSACGAPGNFIYSQDLIGATEGGSSGSAIVNAAGQIVGQLYGSCGYNLSNVCDDVNNRTYDGAFAATWENSALVRQALGNEVGPTEVTLASSNVPSLSRSATWNTSFSNAAGYDNLTFTLAGPNGDGDLYVKYGSAPTTSSYDCRPYLNGTNESCTFDPANTGTYYVMVRAYSAFSGATLTVTSMQTGGCPDADGDGVCDADDVCPGFDDAADADNDGVANGCDNCPSAANPGQSDGDGDGAGDACDACPLDNPDDTDGDGLCDSSDACPLDNPNDTDGDGLCDSADPCPLDNPNDSDGDGVCNSADACPGFPDGADSDGDGVADGCDLCTGNDGSGDADGDGLCDDIDTCVGTDLTDDDGDGFCNASDPCTGFPNVDADGDGLCDSSDPCPSDFANDSDGDGVCDSVDACPGYDDRFDLDVDGVPDACDLCEGDDASGDTDGDGVCNDSDICPIDALDDSDGDGSCDSADTCPGFDDNADSDGDGLADGCDACPTEYGDQADGCPSACDYEAFISGGEQYYNLGVMTTGTPITGTLEWSTSANLDLYLQYYRSGSWRTAASSTSSSPGESINYTVSSSRSGYAYRWRVRRRSGSATYCLSDNL